ncbi:AraC family transcriptional regulator [Mucilaginibacter paludis]|uniref:Transcriptional regulator, AraC family n=1 Tax=Mucilaginibacter paludis DSM 18603 TaxID=714943 RepID=H1YH36_9SPHI|nr:AraC family transcriptional regulator [Mucilaginibacter paludis]EHQ24538.1 transcriptional regulator, AraC family [Mucilaginibacter paludis DSM 18603]
MIAQLYKVAAMPGYSFNAGHDIVPYFYNQWHYHPEIELIHIVRGTGSRFIGDSVDSFKDDDLILIGANLPHLFRNDEVYYKGDSGLLAESFTIHFLPDIFGQTFLSLPENKPISVLLDKAAYGISIHGETKARVKTMMQTINFAPKSERIILLMQLLNVIAYADDNMPIAHFNSSHTVNRSDESRLNKVYQYTLNNFAREITLAEIAAIVYMVPHSFCRYFKSRTNKRYSQFILEVRVSMACKLLSETDQSIAVVCYESGFKNFSNFNRHFKAIAGKSPLEYRKSYREMNK